MDTREFLKWYAKFYLEGNEVYDVDEKALEKVADALMCDDYLFDFLDDVVREECYDQGLLKKEQ
jgi:hypothetical protein